MKLLVITDAWHPQVNGVVRTFERVSEQLEALGHDVTFLAPGQFSTLPCPTYPEIRLALASPGMVSKAIKQSGADAIHIATEGPLGIMGRRYCVRNKLDFTTSYHTKFPEYIAARLPVSERWIYRHLKKFHNSGKACMVATESLRQDLDAKGFENLCMWTRGVDMSLFSPTRRKELPYAKPIHLYVGRVAVEKNIEAFLEINLPGTKLVIGDGPQLDSLQKRYSDAVFLGKKTGEELADYYASSDVFVFPSKTDTFGIVLLEALASGLPVAAYPVTGPKDVLEGCEAAVLSDDLKSGTIEALQKPKDKALEWASRYTWKKSAEMFLNNLHPIRV
jgi:glycosyltransferase involved in cell wall biosynthesis